MNNEIDVLSPPQKTSSLCADVRDSVFSNSALSQLNVL